MKEIDKARFWKQAIIELLVGLILTAIFFIFIFYLIWTYAKW